MTKHDLEVLNNLDKEISELKKMINHNENQKCEFIYFSFGNGSNKEIVCSDSKIIEKVRNLIKVESEIKLNTLETQFRKF